MKILLLPFAMLYGFFVWVRNRLFDQGILSSTEFNIPIIGVGNITVGGTGKTPHVEYLIKILSPTYRLAVLSRGYKRKTSGIVEAKLNSTSCEVGDEPKQIKQKFPDVAVVVSASRRKAIRQILSGHIANNPDIIILDDSYQHRYVKPSISVLLIDHSRPIYEDSLLPLGRLRESSVEKSRANIVIVTKTPVDIKPIEQRIINKNLNLYPYQTLLFSSLRYGKLTPLPGISGSVPSEFTIEGFTVFLLTGIANPLPLRSYLEKQCANIIDLRYPDHHQYTERDLTKIVNVFDKHVATNKIIVTTEKDAVRLSDLPIIKELAVPILYIPIEVVFFDNMSETFARKINTGIRTNRKINI